MPEYRVTFTNCDVEVLSVFAENEVKAIDSAKDIVCIEAAKTPFDIYLSEFGETFAISAEEEKQ